jgi:hypothetical protein
LVFALLINQAALGMFAARMRSVLRYANIEIGWISALRIHLQSVFYFFVLPMSVGIEVARFFKICAIEPTTPPKIVAGALLLDRLLGAVSALALAVVCLAFVHFTVPSRVIWPCAAGAAFMAIGVLAWPRFRRILQTIWNFTRGGEAGLLALFALSMIIHALFAWGIQLGGRGLGLPLTFADTCFAVSGGKLLVALPISLAGIGPAEAGAAAAVGYEPSIAIAAGTLPYLARLAAAAQGGIWELLETGPAAVVATRRMMLQHQLPQAPSFGFDLVKVVAS